MNPIIKEKNFYSIEGCTFWPYIFINKELQDKRKELVINHERIHFKQQEELLVLFFYFIYGLNWFINFLWCWNSDKAYRRIVFEKEAYKYENDPDYIKNRKPYAWLSN
jgi:hypothetical protein